jgi:hypothetical protein
MQVFCVFADAGGLPETAGGFRMKSNLIVMLTHHDRTVSDAMDVFNRCSHLPVACWGFKDVGLPAGEMKALVNRMKEAGKTTFLEVVSYSEEACLSGARLAVEYGFDYLMGTLYSDAVWAYLKQEDIRYLPFVGRVHGSPSILEGETDEIIGQAKSLMEKGIIGFDILAYRHVSDPEMLARRFCMEIPESVTVIAGSINSAERISFMNRIGAWGFTMGSALFEGDFVRGGSFGENLEEVISIMDRQT